MIIYGASTKGYIYIYIYMRMGKVAHSCIHMCELVNTVITDIWQPQL